MNQNVHTSGRQLAKNWGLNIAGQLLPLLVALFTIPFIIRGLGTERFGILSIIWAVLGSLTLFDIGLGRSTTKFVAECLGRGELEKFPGLFWTSLWSQILIGCVGGVAMAALVPYVVDHYLRLSSANLQETKTSLLVLAASFPVVLGGNSIRGVFEAAQRFDIVNYVKAPSSSCIFLLPAIAVPFGLRLSSIVLLLALSRVAVTLTYLVLCLWTFPSARSRCSLDYELLRPLLVYGGWVSISNFVAPLLTYADRFVIGSVLGMSFVTYYTAPNEAISRTSLLPASLLTTLFPALASLDASGAREKIQELCAGAIKTLLLIMTPGLLIVYMFAHQLLQLWPGADFAARSTSVLQIFCIGVLANAFAFVPFLLLQGLGRPDVTGKIHLLELPVYAMALFVLLAHLGLRGAAWAWSFRLVLDACLLFGATSSLKLFSLRNVLTPSIKRGFLLLCIWNSPIRKWSMSR